MLYVLVPLRGSLLTALGTARPQPLSLGGNGPARPSTTRGSPRRSSRRRRWRASPRRRRTASARRTWWRLRDQTLDSLNAYGTQHGQHGAEELHRPVRDVRDAAPHAAAWPPRQPERHQGRLAATPQIQAALILSSDEGDARRRGALELRRRQRTTRGLANEIAGQHVGSREHRQDDAVGIAPANLQNQVTFVMSNGFGRTGWSRATTPTGASTTTDTTSRQDDRAGSQGSAIGGPTLAAERRPGAASGSSEYAALPIDSSTGLDRPRATSCTARRWRRWDGTLAAAVDPASVISQNILSGTVVKPALAS